MADNQTSVIQTAGLTKVFRDFWYRQRVVAVDRLDMDVHRHEVFGLLGPNGSGKTTTIKMLLGLLYPTRGRIRILGKAPTDVAVKSRIGYLPEESYLYRFLNARETLDYYGRLFRIPHRDRVRRVDQLLEMTGLTRESRRRVGEYSKGMARRIGLAQALINDPDLLILDEPTTGLDPVGTREIKDLITFLNREKGKTILLCSHLLADVEDVCHRVTILYGGRERAVGNIHDLLSRENLTQITAEKLSPEIIRKIRDLIEREAQRQVLEVSAPSDKLETFFLRIVREAQQARQATSGATSGGRIAEFLAESATGEAVVASLLEAGRREAEPAATGPEPEAPAEAPEPVGEVIEDLVHTDDRQPAHPAPADEEKPPSFSTPEAEPGDADQDVIDTLVQRADRDRNHSED
jgi:ABC-2 type transport system ATP-binding protein